MITYTGGGKYAIFNGVRFCRDDKTGYYLNSNTSTRLHRAVWESENGEIPEGYEIHHIDHNKGNNDISNLCMLTREDHHRIHAQEMTEELRERLRENLMKTAVPKAKEWHGSEAGREWHRQHYEEVKDRLHIEKTFVCECCGKEYTATATGSNRFCSGRCRAAARRKSGVDNEERKCVVCGNKFTANRYSKSRTCSRQCRGLLRWGESGKKIRVCASV